MLDYRSRSSWRALLVGALAVCFLPAAALAQEVATPPAAPAAPAAPTAEAVALALVQLVAKHAWVPLAALVVHVVLRLLQQGVEPRWVNLPERWKPIAVLVLGQLAAVLDMAAQGTALGWASLGGFVASAVVLLGHSSAPAIEALAAPVASPGDGTPQANPSGEAPPASRDATKGSGAAGLITSALLGIIVGSLLAGCAHPLDTAIRTVNATREVGVLAGETIRAVCLPAYQSATPTMVPKLEATCGRALDAYRSYSTAHVGAVVAVQAAQLGLGAESAALEAALVDAKASAQLAAAVKAVAP